MTFAQNPESDTTTDCNHIHLAECKVPLVYDSYHGYTLTERDRRVAAENHGRKKASTNPQARLQPPQQQQRAQRTTPRYVPGTR